MEMAYRGRWEAEIAAMRRVLAGLAMDEACKWGKPTYTVDGKNIVILQGFKEYFALGFFQGALGPASQARLRGADAGAAEGLPVSLCRGQAGGDTGSANRKSDARDIRGQRVPGTALVQWRHTVASKG